MCLREMVHLRRRSTQLSEALTRKPSVDGHAASEMIRHVSAHRRRRRTKRIDEDIVAECATCADAPARRTIEMGLSAPMARIARVRCQLGVRADASLIEEAITAWQFYATHTILNAPVVAFDAFMRALMSPPSRMSWKNIS